MVHVRKKNRTIFLQRIRIHSYIHIYIYVYVQLLVDTQSHAHVKSKAHHGERNQHAYYSSSYSTPQRKPHHSRVHKPTNLTRYSEITRALHEQLTWYWCSASGRRSPPHGSQAPPPHRLPSHLSLQPTELVSRQLR